MSALKIASEVAEASAALAGLMLVFFGSALSSFDTYSVEQQNSVRQAYRWRAWPAFIAFVMSIGSCALALLALGIQSESFAWGAIWALAFASIGIFASALRAVLDIG